MLLKKCNFDYLWMVCGMEYRSMVCLWEKSFPPAEVSLPAIELLREFACVEGQQNREDWQRKILKK